MRRPPDRRWHGLNKGPLCPESAAGEATHSCLWLKAVRFKPPCADAGLQMRSGRQPKAAGRLAAVLRLRLAGGVARGRGDIPGLRAVRLLREIEGAAAREPGPEKSIARLHGFG
jgi:hypothetical protein